MARDAAAYGTMLQQLAPPGKAWPRDPDSQLGALCLGFGDEFARLDARALDLIEEAYPNTTDEMLPDWERVAGLPDPAIPAPADVPTRRAALVARLTEADGQNAADYIRMIADAFGYAATITNHIPFCADVAHADDYLYDTLSIFWWEVNVTVPIGTTTPIVALEHAVRRRAQLHTYPTFNYIFV